MGESHMVVATKHEVVIAGIVWSNCIIQYNSVDNDTTDFRQHTQQVHDHLSKVFLLC